MNLFLGSDMVMVSITVVWLVKWLLVVYHHGLLVEG